MTLPDDLPSKAMEKVMEIFDLMEIEINEGRPLNLSVWDDRAHQTMNQLWTKTIERLESRVGTNHGIPGEITPRWTYQVCDIFDDMQEEIDYGHQISLSQWRGEFENLMERWWDYIRRRLDNRLV